MTTILVLDTATKTGWCITSGGVVIAHGLLRLDDGIKAKGDFNRQPLILKAAHHGFMDLIALYDPEFIVAEIPHLRGASSFLTVAIYGVAELVASQAEVGFYGVHTASWQSRIVPAPKGAKKVKGDTKVRSVQHVKDRGFNPETDDVADALCIAEYVHDHLDITGDRVPFSTGLAA